MTKSGRIACINPSCRRTAAAEKCEQGDEIICGKCFRAMPPRLRLRYQQLRRREKRLLRLIERRIARHDIDPTTISTIRDRLFEQYAVNWQLIRDYFLRPDKPAGLDRFLQEVGL